MMKVYKGELIRVLEENLLERMLGNEEVRVCANSLNEYQKKQRKTLCYKLGELEFEVTPPLENYHFYRTEKCDNIKS